MQNPEFQRMYEKLLGALEVSHAEQQALLQATDEAYVFLDEANESLTDEQYLAIKVVLGEAETRLGRYFGM